MFPVNPTTALLRPLAQYYSQIQSALNDSTQNSNLHSSHQQSTSPLSITSETDTSPDLEIINDQSEMIDLRIDTKKIQDSNYSAVLSSAGRESNYSPEPYLKGLPTGGAPGSDFYRELERRSISPQQRRLKDYSISSIMQ